jgi:hypothetical protein
VTGVGPIAISLNGVDNIGKTTQLRWLHSGLQGAHRVGGIDGWNPRWQAAAAGDFAHWWFVGSTTAEHVELVLDSHRARRAASGPLALEDRGLPMLRATCAATAVIKERISVEAAIQLVDRIAADLPCAGSREELHLLLRRSSDPGLEALGAIRRERAPVGQRYAAYQRALATILAHQADNGEYHAVVDTGEAPILDVQDRIRATLGERGIDTARLPCDVERLWVLGGLSESGKSTVGELLRDEHGVTRLKIGYLLEIAALRVGVTDPYAQWSEPEQAEQLTEELLRFAATTKARHISLESAHRFQATEHLRRVWGERCRVLYVDADPAARAGRAAESAASLRARDTVKRSRGADRIAEIADHVVDNSGPLSGLKLRVARLAVESRPRRSPAPAAPVRTASWLEQATAQLVDDDVALVLSTGSTGTERWREGWSDLDLLVVRDTLPVRWLRTRVGSLAGPRDAKIGVSSFTTADIEALRVPPRVVQSLRQAAEGTGVLYRRAGYRIRIPTHADSDRASRGELGLVLMTTRRLLHAAQVDARALHKHAVLLCKILLRADGVDLSEPDAVFAAFAERHHLAGCAPPDLDDLAQHPTDARLVRLLCDVTEQLLGYIDTLGHLERTGA